MPEESPAEKVYHYLENLRENEENDATRKYYSYENPIKSNKPSSCQMATSDCNVLLNTNVTKSIKSPIKSNNLQESERFNTTAKYYSKDNGSEGNKYSSCKMFNNSGCNTCLDTDPTNRNSVTSTTENKLTHASNLLNKEVGVNDWEDIEGEDDPFANSESESEYLPSSQTSSSESSFEIPLQDNITINVPEPLVAEISII